MPVVVATRADGLSIEVDTASSLITGTATRQVPHREATFAFLLITRAPAVLTYQTIAAEVLHPDGIGLPPSDSMTPIRKLKLATDRTLASVTGGEELISSVRGFGYRLDGSWEVSRPRRHQSDQEAAVSQLNALADRCISLMRRTPLVNAGEDAGFVLDRASCTAELAELDSQFGHCISLVLNEIEPGYSVSLDALLQLIGGIHSYFTFNRIGKVDERTWRSLFVQELLSKVAILTTFVKSGEER